MPSIWQKELPNCSLAMSFRPGNSPHSARAGPREGLVVAPQRGQLAWEGSIGAPHQAHFAVVEECGGAAAGGVEAAGAAGWGRLTAAPQPPQKFAPSGILAPQ